VSSFADELEPPAHLWVIVVADGRGHKV
jgi:hypothetical protein